MYGMYMGIIAMTPEKELLDRAIEALQNYRAGINFKDGVNEPPETEVTSILMKFRTLGKSPDEVYRESSDQERHFEAMHKITNFSNSDN